MKLKLILIGVCALFGLMLVLSLPDPTLKEVLAFVGSCTLFGIGLSCVD